MNTRTTPTTRHALDALAGPSRTGAARAGGSIATVALFGFALLALLVLLVPDAEATHFRGGTLTWEPTGSPREIELNGTLAFRTSYPDWNTAILPGRLIVPYGGIAEGLRWGDGSFQDFRIRVSSINPAHDYFTGYIVDPAGNPLRHTFSTPTNGSGAFVVSWTDSARMSAPNHRNNPDAQWRLETLVYLLPPPNSPPGTPPNTAPIAALPPLVVCTQNTLCTFKVPTTDDNGDALTYRLADILEATGTTVRPWNIPSTSLNVPDRTLSVNQHTGQVVWNTTGAALSPSGATYYSVQIMVSDGGTKVPVDFFIKLVPPTSGAPTFLKPNVCGAQLHTLPDVPLTFQVAASSSNASRTVRLAHLGLPPGASFPIPSTANPVVGTFSWTPTLQQIGSYMVTFTTLDNLDNEGEFCAVQIVVDPPGAPTSRFNAPPGAAVGFPVPFNDTSNASAGNTIVAWSWQFGDGNTSSQQNVTHAYAEPGNYTVQLVVTSSNGLTGRSERSILVSGVPPAPTNLTALGGVRNATLTWDVSTGGGFPPTAQRVYRDGVALATIAAANTSFVDATLGNGVTATYAISAVNNVGESARSLPASATTIALPGQPSANGERAVQAVRVFWEEPSGSPTAYNLYREGLVHAAGLTTRSYVDAGLAYGEVHNYTVTAINAAGEGPASANVQVAALDDVTPPVITATRTSPNANGWNSGAVTVDFSCSDDESGIAVQPVDVTLSSEGADQSATSSCADAAGNTASLTVENIDIDLSVPRITRSLSPAPLADCAPSGGALIDDDFDAQNGGRSALRFTGFSGWQVTGGSVDLWQFGNPRRGLSVDLDGSSSAGGTLESGAVSLAPGCYVLRFQISSNGVPTNTMTVTLGSLYSETFSRSNNANFELVTRRIDVPSATTAKLVFDEHGNDNFGIAIDEVLLAPMPGWATTDVTATFTCTDSVSGVLTSPTSPVLFTTEGADQSATAQCRDRAGWLTTVTLADVDLDKTAPVLTATRTPANAEGWNNGAVTVDFSCADDQSGVAVEPVDVTLPNEGADQTATASCTDLAGNPASLTVEDIHIDLTAPQGAIAGACADPGAGGWCADDALTVTPASTDAGSGVQHEECTLDGASVPCSGSERLALAGRLPVATWGAESVVVGPGIYLFGGFDPVTGQSDRIVRFDPATGSATTLAGTLPVPAVDMSGIYDGTYVYLFGGWSSAGGATDDIVRFDPATGTAVLLPETLPSARHLTAAVWDGTHVYVFGGTADWSSEPPTDEIVRYDPATGDVDTLAQRLPVALFGSGAVWTGEEAYLFGGHGLAGDSADIVRFTPAGGATTVGQLPVAMRYPGAAWSGSHAYVMAGSPASVAHHIFRFDPTAGVTTMATTFSSAYVEREVAWHGDSAYAFGGAPGSDEIYRFTPASGMTLGQGSHVVCVTPTDRAGNVGLEACRTEKLDSVPPEITATRTDANDEGWNNGAVTVDFVCTDALSGVFTQPTDVTLSSEGADQSATASCSDGAGNAATLAVEGIHIDLTPPVVTEDRRVPPANAAGWHNADTSVVWECFDALSGATYPGNVQLHPLSTEGVDQSLEGECFDLAGNAATMTFTGIHLDKTPPSIALVSVLPPPNADGWNREDTTFTWECTDALSGPVSSSVTLTLTGEGADLAAVGACADVAGNTAQDARTADIDRTAPDASMQVSCGNEYQADWCSSLSVWASGADALSGVAALECLVDGVSRSCPAAVIGDSDTHALSVRVTDRAGNAATTSSAHRRVDPTPPTASIDVTCANAYGAWCAGDANGALPYAMSATDALSGVKELDCRIDGQPAPCTGTITSEGMHELMLVARDNVYNSQTIVVTRGLDATGPAIVATHSCASPGENGWCRGGLEFQGSATDALSGIESSACSLDGAASDCVVGTTSDAVHDFAVVASDRVGNAASAQVTIGLDQAPPVVSLVSRTPANANGWNSGDVTVTWECGDAVSGPVAGTITQIVATEGADLSATGVCRDQAGNSASDTLAGIGIDRTPPTLALVSRTAPNAAGWNAGPVEIEWSCTDALSGVASFEPTVTLASEGADQSATSVCVDAADLATSDTQAGVSIDLTAPTFDPYADVETDANEHGGATLDFALPSAHDAVSGIATMACDPAPGSFFPLGTTTVACLATDVAGHEQELAFTVTVTLAPLDHIAVSGPATMIVNTSAPFTFAGFDAFENPVPLAVSRITYTAPTRVGLYEASHTEQGVTGRQAVQVVAGPLASLTIEGPHTLVAGTTATYLVQGFDAYGNAVPTSVSSLDFTAPTVAGPASVAYAEGDVDETLAVTVVADALASIAIAGETTIVAGTTHDYALSGSDQYGNDVPLAQSSLAFTAPTTVGPATVEYAEAGVAGALVVDVVADALASITLTGPAQVHTGYDATYALAGFDQHGNAVPLQLSEIVYTAPQQPGTYLVSYSEDGVTGTASVQVVLPPVERVVVAPASAVVNVNRTLALSAQAFDANGRLIPYAPIAWSTSFGTVTQAGLFKAASAGAANVSATSGGVAGIAAVTVSDVLDVVVEIENPDIGIIGNALRGTVTVRYLDGSPVQGAAVVVTLRSGGLAQILPEESASGWTNATGQYRFAIVPLAAPPGNYTVVAEASALGNAGEGSETFTLDPLDVQLAQTVTVATGIERRAARWT